MIYNGRVGIYVIGIVALKIAYDDKVSLAAGGALPSNLTNYREGKCYAGAAGQTHQLTQPAVCSQSFATLTASYPNV